MADLIGIQISELTTSPSLADTTFLPIQRVGIEIAEKVNLQNLSSYLINSTLFSTYIDTSVNSKINSHVISSDPHGDRAYTNTLLQNHIVATDPHGDRAYSDTKLNTTIQNHTIANDPHGDRAYATTAIQNHTLAVDPHGDRAYTNGKLIENLTTSNTYTDTQIQLKLTTQLGVTIAPLVDGKVPTTYITSSLLFNNRSSFPSTGTTSILYVDTAGDDIYRWNGTTYTNLTPAVNVESLNLTTDNVAQGSNNERSYLTQALKTKYDEKISEVIVTEEIEPKNNIIKEVDNDKIVKLKNIQTESSITLIDNDNSIIITDNIYNYEGTTSTSVITLENKDTFKLNVLENVESSKIYNITGDIDCISYNTSNNIKYVNNNEKIKIDACVGLFGNLASVAIPTNLTINDEGTIITGNSIANKQIKVFNSVFEEISTANVLSDTTFIASLSTPVINGSPIYVYTIDGEARSSGVTLISPNKGDIKEPTLITVSTNGLILTGIAEKNSTISVLKTGDIEIGSATSTVEGYFTITLSEEVIEEQVLTIKATNQYSIITSVTYTTKICPFTSPTEFKLNNERTQLEGKVEPNSVVKVLVDTIELETILIDNTGIFNSPINIDENVSEITINIVKNTDEYNTQFILNTYINETNKPKEILKVISSEFQVIRNNKEYLNNKTNYEVSLVIENNSILIQTSNSENITTKWDAKLRVTTITL